MQSQLSNELIDILSYAKEEAMRLGNYTVSTDHLVLGMLRHRENAVVETLAQFGANTAQLHKGDPLFGKRVFYVLQ